MPDASASITFLVICCLWQAVSAVVTCLPPFNVDIHQTSLSGLSSGAFMAVQAQVAHSDIVKGVGIFAGGPYDCADGLLAMAMTTCMKGLPPPFVDSYVLSTLAAADSQLIADPKHLANHSVYLFSGKKDATVDQSVMDSLYKYYKLFVKQPIEYVNSMDAAHTQPTDDPANQNPCDLSAPPYLSNCNYDGAGAVLKKIYGSLNPRNDGVLNGQLLAFDQSEFLAFPHTRSIASEGYAYIPEACAKGQLCRLHISFHGCKQNAESIGLDYVKHSGYNRWADTNKIIVLYPQTVKQSITPYNPNGCWDWWGYNGDPFTYPTRAGAQIRMIKAMIDRISSDYAALPAPDTLTVTDVTNHTVTLTWSKVPQATGFDVYLSNGQQMNTERVVGLSYTITSLVSGTQYIFAVQSVNADEYHSASSPEVTVVTKGTPPKVQPPQGLRVLMVSSSSATLSWESEHGATGYKLYRNSTLVGTLEVTTYTDLPLSPLTAFEYRVVAFNSAYESDQSPAVYARTEAAWLCRQVTAHNVAHVQDGRADLVMGWVFARGSGECLGLWNVLSVTTVAEVKLGYWAMTICPP